MKQITQCAYALISLRSDHAKSLRYECYAQVSSIVHVHETVMCVQFYGATQFVVYSSRFHVDNICNSTDESIFSTDSKNAMRDTSSINIGTIVDLEMID